MKAKLAAIWMHIRTHKWRYTAITVIAMILILPAIFYGCGSHKAGKTTTPPAVASNVGNGYFGVTNNIIENCDVSGAWENGINSTNTSAQAEATNTAATAKATVVTTTNNPVGASPVATPSVSSLPKSANTPGSVVTTGITAENITAVAQAAPVPTNPVTIWNTGDGNITVGDINIGSAFATVKTPQAPIQTSPPQQVVVVYVTNTVEKTVVEKHIERYGETQINSGQGSNWPGQKAPDKSYCLGPRPCEVWIPANADYKFYPPPIQQGEYDTHVSVISGNADSLCIALNGVPWDRRQDNDRLKSVQEYRYWNRSPTGVCLRFENVPRYHRQY